MSIYCIFSLFVQFALCRADNPKTQSSFCWAICTFVFLQFRRSLKVQLQCMSRRKNRNFRNLVLKNKNSEASMMRWMFLMILKSIRAEKFCSEHNGKSKCGLYYRGNKLPCFRIHEFKFASRINSGVCGLIDWWVISKNTLRVYLTKSEGLVPINNNLKINKWSPNTSRKRLLVLVPGDLN